MKMLELLDLPHSLEVWNLGKSDVQKTVWDSRTVSKQKIEIPKMNVLDFLNFGFGAPKNVFCKSRSCCMLGMLAVWTCKRLTGIINKEVFNIPKSNPPQFGWNFKIRTCTE